MQTFYPQIAPFLACITAFVITYFGIPAIINLSLLKKLYDLPDSRKIHGRRIAALGGISIFGGMIFSFIFFTNDLYYPQFNSILAALIILFVTGIKDDLYPLVHYKKFLGQLTAVIIVTVQGNVRIVSLYGLFGVHQMNYWFSLIFSIFFFLAIINSFNFIDGINGLAGGVGVLVCGIYAYWFAVMGETLFLILSLCMAGSLLAFLRYNLIRAHIFMGDSGALVLGFLAALLTVYFIQRSQTFQPNYFFEIAAMVYAFALLIIPIFDTLRVVIIRLAKGRSPFAADRNHIHHALLDIGLTHLQAALLLFAINIGFVALTSILKLYMNPKFQLLIILLLALGLSQIPFLIKQRQKRLGRYHPQ